MLLNRHIDVILSLRLVGSKVITVLFRSHQGTGLEASMSGINSTDTYKIEPCETESGYEHEESGSGTDGYTIPSGDRALPRFKPGCLSLRLCRAVARVAETLPAIAGKGIRAQQAVDGRLISRPLPRIGEMYYPDYQTEEGGPMPPPLQTARLFRSLDAFVDDWNSMMLWVLSIWPIAGPGIALSDSGDKTVVMAENKYRTVCPECDICDVCDVCDGCDTCDPCDPCDTCDMCDIE